MSESNIIVIAFAFVMAGNLDRIRGDVYDLMNLNKSVDAFFYGIAIAICINSSIWWTYPLFAVLWVAGASVGWGVPVGVAVTKQALKDRTKFHSWQVGILRKNVWLALAARGFIWGVPPALLAFFDLAYISMLGMTVIFPLAVWLDRNYDLFPTWEEQEYYRGWLIAAVAITGGIFL